jgi:hypothetical protein
MNVMDRWRNYRDDASFRAIFAADPELGQLSEELFDFDPLKSARTRGQGDGYRAHKNARSTHLTDGTEIITPA